MKTSIPERDNSFNERSAEHMEGKSGLGKEISSCDEDFIFAKIEEAQGPRNRKIGHNSC